ncbi:unnamed protein product [Clonostachys rhizophaga]|uniref:Tetratricopeptide repeat protein 1 n=1 Tax=Clonostachys rhizophaga TaxID=160324 RepID=A0A9N9VNA7_9HYPO|nr:unnamed protein product [Clonostachys rhizophaga]
MATAEDKDEKPDAPIPRPKQHSRQKSPPPAEEDEEDEVKLTPEEEAAALQESQTIKADANTLFSSNDFENAISRYEDALLPLPRSAYFPRAVLHSNVAACHLKLEQWKEAVKSATASLTALEALEQPPAPQPKDDDQGEEEEVEEIVSAGAAKAHDPSAQPSDIQRIRIKALLRRARAHAQSGTWSSLAAAEADYRELEKLPSGSLTPADARTVRSQLRELPPRVKEAQERETAEMWGKLKDLGNGLLKPFGLSTDNFQMVKDEKTGGYSMNFNQGNGSKS